MSSAHSRASACRWSSARPTRCAWTRHPFAASDGALDVLLTAARKYSLSLVLAAQALALFPTRFQTIAVGNAGNQFLFRLRQKEAQPVAHDLFERNGSPSDRASTRTTRWSI